MTLSISTIQSKSGLEAVLSTLGFALPPSTVVHVGVGEGSGATCVWMNWGVKRAVLVEADGNKLKFASDLLVQKGLKLDQFHALADVVAGSVEQSVPTKNTDVSFYKASHSREDGLVSPDALRAYWPSLSLNTTLSVKTTTVDDIIQSVVQVESSSENDSKSDSKTSPKNHINSVLNGSCWLVVDCLPGKEILSGSVQLLDQTSVLCVRVLKDSRQSTLDIVTESTVQALDEFLLELGSESHSNLGNGFKRVAFVADSHPEVGYAVYCRGSDAIVEDKQKPLLADIATKNAQLVALQQSLGEANEALAQLKAQAQEKNAQEEKQIAELSDLLQAHQQAETDYKQSVIKLKAELQKSQESVVAAKSESETVKKHSEDIKSKLEEQSRLLSDTQQQLKECQEQWKVSQAQSQQKQMLLQSQLDEQLKLQDQAQEQAQEKNTQHEKQIAELSKLLQAHQQAEAEHKQSVIKLKADLQKSYESVVVAKSESETVKKSQADLQKQLTDKTQDLKSVQANIEVLKAENNELNHRQQLMNEELVKAEGQIELIKDLLLREAGI